MPVLRQPDDVTCGPTCLQAVYDYWGDKVTVQQVIDEIPALPGGGTLAVSLGCHALQRGYRVKLVSFNLMVFDPTWFAPGAPPLVDRLERRRAARGQDSKLHHALEQYVRFVELGGEVAMEDLSRGLIRKPLQRGLPILTGLSSTFLYHTQRDHPVTGEDDDVGGDPQGHFVVLCGYDGEERRVTVSDPYFPNPVSHSPNYSVGIDRVISSILLGVLTYDANLLFVQPAEVSGGAPQ